MSSIANLVPKQFDQSALSGNFQSRNLYSSTALQATRVTASASLSKDIIIETAEGDKVTLSFKNDTSILAASYDALYQEKAAAKAENGDLRHQQTAQVHADLFAYSQESQFSMTVEGDLNEQERRDLQEALERIDKLMMKTLQGGDLLQGAKEAAEIKELESIATVEADYRYQSLVTIEEMSRVSSAADYGNVGALRPGAFESGYLEGGLPGLGLIDSPAFRPDSRPASRPDFQKDQIQDLIDRMAEVIKEWEAEKKLKPEQFIRPLEKLFADHLEKLKDNPQAHARQELFRELGDGLLDQVRNMTTGSVLDITPSQDNIV